MWFTLSVTDLCNCPCIYTCGRGVDHAHPYWCTNWCTYRACWQWPTNT